MNKFLVLTLVLIVFAAVALGIYIFYPESCGKPVTCTSDEQCGGEVIAERFCQGSAVYGNGQINTCRNANSCNAVCETSYATILLEECANGCSNGACIEG